MKGGSDIAIDMDIRKAPVQSPPEIAGRYDDYRVEPFGDDALAFRLIVPADMDAIALDDVEVPAGGQRVIGAFETRAEPVHRLEVAVVRPGYEVDVLDYVGLTAELSGLAVEEAQWIRAGGGKTGVESVLRFGEGPGGRVARSFAFADGPRIFLVTLVVPPADEKARLDAYALARDSFEPLLPWGARYAEGFEPHEAEFLTGAPPIRFLRPLSWRLDEVDDPTFGRCVIALRLVDGLGLRARLKLAAVVRGEEEEPLRRFLDAVCEAAHLDGFAPVGASEVYELDAPGGGGFEPRALGAHSTGWTADGGRADLLGLALRTPDVSYGIVALLPDPAADAIGWLAGKRAQAILAQSLREGGGGSR